MTSTGWHSCTKRTGNRVQRLEEVVLKRAGFGIGVVASTPRCIFGLSVDSTTGQGLPEHGKYCQACQVNL